MSGTRTFDAPPDLVWQVPQRLAKELVGAEGRYVVHLRAVAWNDGHRDAVYEPIAIDVLSESGRYLRPCLKPHVVLNRLMPHLVDFMIRTS